MNMTAITPRPEQEQSVIWMNRTVTILRPEHRQLVTWMNMIAITPRPEQRWIAIWMSKTVLTPRSLARHAVCIPEHPYANSSAIKQSSITPISTPPVMFMIF
jgi:hypothetical protein